MTTLTDQGDSWSCSCGNDENGGSFAPCTEDGEECAPDEDGSWAGHYRCNRCLFVFTESDIIREA